MRRVEPLVFDAAQPDVATGPLMDCARTPAADVSVASHKNGPECVRIRCAQRRCSSLAWLSHAAVVTPCCACASFASGPIL